ncbi:hypothetical protein WUBG_01460 [Wuchereria bancrofti]|uniref:Uncharacterized protein n=1 Tax=Wuchereria bancrofti TaxID=6293 RepID=J9BJQ1_WUCBA|nr:hypothetical protein WUBG_01460 [Wuchereria bancrofti]
MAIRANSLLKNNCNDDVDKRFIKQRTSSPEREPGDGVLQYLTSTTSQANKSNNVDQGLPRKQLQEEIGTTPTETTRKRKSDIQSELLSNYCKEEITIEELIDKDNLFAMKYLPKILNDFYGWFSPAELFNLADSKKHIVPIKGGFSKFTSKAIVITSNKKPEHWWKNEVIKKYDMRALLY